MSKSDDAILLLSASSGVDPSSVSLAELAMIRGAMWTVTGQFPLGPRPNQSDNIFAYDYFEQYDAATRRRGIQAAKDRRYVNVPHGPIVADGYHGDFASEDWRSTFDRYLDFVEELWDGGLRPVEFLKPDGWSPADLETLEPLFVTPRCQRLFRIVVPSGWEPWMTNPDFVRIMRWSARVFPKALRLIHLPPDHDAPGLSSEAIEGGEMWTNVAPYTHGYLIQNAAFAGGPTGPDFENFKGQFNAADKQSIKGRFRTGYAGWPTFSAFGDEPMRSYAGEYASEWVYNYNRPEAQARAWGQAAMLAGADGFFDGGIV